MARGAGQLLKMDLNSCEAEGGAGGELLWLFWGSYVSPHSSTREFQQALLPHSLLVSPGPGPGGLLHSHFPLPHAGGAVDSRGDATGSSPRNSVLPVPQHHTSVGSPGEKLLQGHCRALGVIEVYGISRILGGP